jgi:dimethylargininase
MRRLFPSRSNGSKCIVSIRQRLYSLAITRELPDSFGDALAAHAETTTEPLSMERARQQHGVYVQVLRSILPVLSLPALPEYPDSCFVEDTVVAIGNHAVITRPGHASRQGEVDNIKTILQQLGMKVTDMRDCSGTATCDGGDVLFTGSHLFIGLSNRTNQDGADVLRDIFRTNVYMDVTVVPPMIQGDQVLHLKSAVTNIDEITLLAPTGAAGDQLLAAMRATELNYNVYRLPDMLSCNVVSCNGVVLVQDTACLQSRKILEEAVLESSMDLVFVDTSELAKKDAALTCCSILLDI